MADTLKVQDLGIISNQATDRLVAALDRNTTALLTVATMIGKASNDITGGATPEWLKESVLRIFNELVPDQSQS